MDIIPHNHKLALIEGNAQRLGLADKVKTQKLDASQVHQVFAADSFDKILVDAPCSTGVHSRNLISNITSIPSILSPFKAVQLDILSSVCQTLRVV